MMIVRQTSGRPRSGGTARDREHVAGTVPPSAADPTHLSQIIAVTI